MHELGTILGVWAHPDDETYLTAGLMAHGVRNGSRVVCVTATRGEGGSPDEELYPTEKMGAVREEELMRSLAVLGVTEHIWLDLPDIDMDTPLPDVGAARVRAIMEEVQPETVLTFGPDGMTDHAAHKSVSAWTTLAFEEVGKPEATLHYATTTPEWAQEFVPIYNRYDVFRPGTPPVTPHEDLSIDYPLPPDLLDLKLKAIAEHVSQVGMMIAAFGEDIFLRAMKDEVFRPAGVKGE